MMDKVHKTITTQLHYFDSYYLRYISTSFLFFMNSMPHICTLRKPSSFKGVQSRPTHQKLQDRHIHLNGIKPDHLAQAANRRPLTAGASDSIPGQSMWDLWWTK
jgi:hypothetical protein